MFARNKARNAVIPDSGPCECGEQTIRDNRHRKRSSSILSRFRAVPGYFPFSASAAVPCRPKSGDAFSLASGPVPRLGPLRANDLQRREPLPRWPLQPDLQRCPVVGRQFGAVPRTACLIRNCEALMAAIWRAKPHKNSYSPYVLRKMIWIRTLRRDLFASEICDHLASNQYRTSTSQPVCPEHCQPIFLLYDRSREFCFVRLNLFPHIPHS